MVEAMLRRGRRKEAGRMAAAAVDYATMGWPVCLGAHLRDERSRQPRPGEEGEARVLDTGRACSCDRRGGTAGAANTGWAAWVREGGTDEE